MLELILVKIMMFDFNTLSSFDLLDIEVSKMLEEWLIK